MMRLLLSGMFLFLGVLRLKGQDKIISTHNDTLLAKITKVDSLNIWYEWKNEGNTFLYKAPKTEIRFVIRENGSIDTFNYAVIYINKIKVTQINVNDTNAQRSFSKGYNDAMTYFEAGDYVWSTATPAFCCLGVGGVVVAAATCLTKVSEYRLNRNEVYETSKDQNYKYGFAKGAEKKRNRKAWLGVAYGVGALTGMYVAIIGIMALTSDVVF